MKRKSIITVLALVLVLALSLSIFSACNKKHKYSSEWKFDDKTHWHECTTKKHTDTTEKLPHEFKEEIVKAADYGVVGEKKFTCKDCGYSYTEDIDALGAKDNEIKLQDGKTLDKTYDGSAVDVSDKFSFNGNGEVTLMFKAQGAEDDAYAATAPKNAGEYTVKVSVRATAEWKATSKTFDFAIAKKVLTATGTKVYNGSATMPATLTGVVAGETVTATITMDSKNVGATVQSVVLEGADKDNYVIDKTKVTASITQKEIPSLPVYKSYTGEKEFGASFGSSVIVAGDDIRAKITMVSKNAGAAVQGVTLVGADKDNYTIKMENVKVTVVPREIKIKDLEVEYNGMSKYILVNIQASSADATKYNFVTGDHVNLSLIFNGKANAGDTQAQLKSISLNGNDAENYKKPEISNVTVTVLQRSITVMNREFKKTKVGAGQFEGSTLFALTEEEGFVAGETELKIGIKDTAVASYAVGGPYNMEFVEDRFVLSGDGKGNYKVVGAVGCTLTISGKEVTLNATYVDASDNPISGIEGNFSVTIDDKGISSQTAQGDLAEYLMKGENKNKNVEVTMEVIDGSVTIAAFSRVGVNTQSDLSYVCNYGSFEVSGDQPTFIEFALFNYNTQYIDENGTWIYTDTTTLNVRIKIRFYDIATLDKNTPAIDAIGANYTAVFETTVDSGEYGSVCTLDLEWTSEKITGSEVVVYNALTGSEINFNKVNEKQYTFDAIAGNTKFYVYVEGVGGDNQVSLKVTLTCALNEGTPTRLEFSAGANELSSGELTYAAGEEKRFVISAGAGVSFGMKYTISNIPAGATIKVYRADGTEVTLSTDNSFELLRNVPVRDYTIVVTNTTDNNLNINFSITKEQTPGTIVIS
ncbi:MAG: YDG domain-containing protein [Christensenellales bacterium]